MIRLLSIPLFYFLLMLILLSTISCSKKEVRMIQTDEQLLEVTQDFCEEMYKKQKKNKFYSCASAISSDMQLSQTKSLLLAKVKIAEQVISTIDSKESFDIKDNNSGVTKDFQKISSSLVNFDLSGYKIVEQKTIKHLNKWRTFTLLKFKI